jgi:hypothetical protein
MRYLVESKVVIGEFPPQKLNVLNPVYIPYQESLVMAGIMECALRYVYERITILFASTAFKTDIPSLKSK